jgi:hypothetical protein
MVVTGLLVVASNTTRSQAAGPAKSMSFIAPPPPPVANPDVSPSTIASETEAIRAKSIRPDIQKATGTKSALDNSTKPAIVGTRPEATKEQARKTISTKKQSSSVAGVRAALKKLNPFHRKGEPAQTANVTK